MRTFEVEVGMKVRKKQGLDHWFMKDGWWFRIPNDLIMTITRFDGALIEVAENNAVFSCGWLDKVADKEEIKLEDDLFEI